MEKGKLKVLHLLESDRFSGAENVVCQIFEMLRDWDYEMAYSSMDGQIREALAKRGIPFRPMKKLTLKEAHRVVQAYKPDIIHAHDMRASVIASIVGGRAKVISHMHGNNSKMRKLNARTLAYLACSSRFGRIIWVSRSSFESYRFTRQISRKSAVLYNTLNPKQVMEKAGRGQAEAYDVVFLGRMSYPKNPEKLLRVLRLAADKNPCMRAAVIGDGELFESTRCLAKEMGLADNVTFLGFLENPMAILKNAKVMVMTSRYEGTPMCALEAMILGVPIVSTPVDGLADLVEDCENGFLAEADEELADCIGILIMDGEKRRRMSVAAQKKAEAYIRISEYRDQIIKFYSI